MICSFIFSSVLNAFSIFKTISFFMMSSHLINGIFMRFPWLNFSLVVPETYFE